MKSHLSAIFSYKSIFRTLLYVKWHYLIFGMSSYLESLDLSGNLEGAFLKDFESHTSYVALSKIF